MNVSIQHVRKRAMAALKPPTQMPLANWIEKNIFLPDTVAAQSGRVRLWAFQRGICDAIDDPEIERVTVIKPVRVGFSTLLTSTLASYVANNPCAILNIHPTENDCRDAVISEIDPVFEASPALRGLITGDNLQAGDRNTILSRRFPAGSLKLIASRSPRNLRRHTAKVLLLDEIDAYETTSEGDPLTLAERRTLTFPDRKIIAGSTPVFDHGPVSRLYAQSDKRIFECKCPSCGTFTEIMWKDIIWEPEKPETAHYVCPQHGCVVDERHKPQMVKEGRWRATAPEVKGHAGFRLNALVSPHVNASWAKIAAEFLQAKNSPDTLQTFTNTLLGQPWREAADELNESDLANRREPFGLSAIPPEVLILTAGVDCQDDRLECTMLGHDKAGGVFVLSHTVLWGRYDSNEVWQELDDLLRSSWPHPNGGTLRIDAAIIDSGDGQHSPHVHSFTRSRFNRHVVSGKGAAGFSRPPIQRATTKGVPLFLIGVDGIKSQLFAKLSRGNSIRFSQDLESVFFEQLASERQVVRYVRGAPTKRFERIKGKRAETLDSTVYAIAARSLASLSLDRRESELATPAAPVVKPISGVIRSAWLER